MELPSVLNTLTREELQQRADQRSLRGLFYVGNDDYHAGPGLSSTGIKRLLQSPAHFKTPAKEDTPALRFGTLVHEALLEPELFAKKYTTIPDALVGVSKAKNPHKAMWDQFKAFAEQAKLEIMDRDDWDTVAGIARSVQQSQLWPRIIDGARFEVAAYMQDGVPLPLAPDEPAEHAKAMHVLRKVKADILAPGLIGDLKTCSDARPEAFARSIMDYGYHISAAYYLDTFSAVMGEEISTFVWVGVEKKPPYAVRFYVASPRMIEIGRQEYQRALRLYAECNAKGEWPGYPETFEDIELPAYYLRRFE